MSASRCGTAASSTSIPVPLRAGISEVQHASPAAPMYWMPTTAPVAMASGRAAVAVAGPGAAGDAAVDEVPGLGIGGLAEAQRVQDRDGARAHGEDVAEDPADAGRGTLKRLDERGMVVALHLEDHRPAVADLHGPRVLAGALQQVRGPRGQPTQEHARVLVGAVLGPEGGEETELGVGRLAAEPLDYPMIFVEREPQALGEVWSDLRLSPGQTTPGSPLEEGAVLDQRAEERLEEQKPVGAAHRCFRRALGMGHEPEHRARLVDDARDVLDVAVGVGRLLHLAVAGGVAEHDPLPRLQGGQRRCVGVVLALAVRDRHREYLPRAQPTCEGRL